MPRIYCVNFIYFPKLIPCFIKALLFLHIQGKERERINKIQRNKDIRRLRCLDVFAVLADSEVGYAFKLFFIGVSLIMEIQGQFSKGI